MNTKTHAVKFSDATCMAYGQEVRELLSTSSPSVWADELWTIYTGYMLAQKELGYNPHIGETFCSFKELLFFFNRLEGVIG